MRDIEGQLEDRRIQRTALIQVEKQLREGTFTVPEQRRLREICMRWLEDPKCGKRSRPRYLSIAARLEANDLAKTKIALDAVQEAKQSGDIHLHGTGPVQINIADQLSELRKAAPTVDERRALLHRLESEQGGNGNGNGKH
jgi:hypothetical protein